MNGSPVIFTLLSLMLLSFVAVVSADNPDFTPIDSNAVGVALPPLNNQTFDVRASVEELNIPAALSTPQTNGLVLDYYPFETGFRVSAGTFSGESKRIGENNFLAKC